jgi:nicotinamide-nucleotide amidase
VSAIKSAVILAVGTELTTGTTRDTNSGDLARELTSLGVRLLSTMALPDDLARVTDAFRDALSDADLVVSTGGLGPTPDDLTREAIAAACGLEVREDPELLAWLDEMFSRRGAPMPDANRKQSWLIDGATALHNAHGSAPGWWVARPDGRIVIALPGPPREMWPMWREQALPRLQGGSLGSDRASHTLRLTGIGESALVGLLGEEVLREANPQVATYARADAVDLVVSAESDGPLSAREIVDQTVSLLREKVGRYEFAQGDETWADALATVIGERSLSVVEIGTAGQVAALLGDAPFLRFAELLRADDEVAHAAANLAHYAQRVRDIGHTDIGMAVFARQTRDTHVRIAIASEAGVAELKRTAFLAGDEGRRRAALAASAALWETLRSEEAK